MCERLRLPLQLTASRCECGAALDKCGRHRGACTRSGRLKSRATAPERTLARVCREAGGGTVRTHVKKLRDLNTSVPVLDDWSIEVLASGLQMHHGAQLAVDIHPQISCHVVRCNLSQRLHSERCNSGGSAGGQREQIPRAVGRRQVPVGCGGARNGTGGRWSVEALNFIECLASGRAREATPLLRRSSFLGWRRRWTRTLSISCSRAFAGSLISSQADALEGVVGAVPDLADLFGQFRIWLTCDMLLSASSGKKSCVSELQQQAYAQRWELQDAQHGYVESRREQVHKKKYLDPKHVRNGKSSRTTRGNARPDEC